jgi:PAS domain S-box-containing protein
MSQKSKNNAIVWGSVAFALLLFALDIPFPRGVTPAALYVAVVGASLWLPGIRPTWMAAVGCTILTILGCVISPPGPLWADIYNRTFAVLGVWAVALLCVLYKRTEQRTLELASIVESSGEAILSNDLGGIVTSWNGAAEGLFGYLAEEMLGRQANFMLARERRNEGSFLFDAAKAGQGTPHFETVCARKDGSSVPVALSISPIVNSGGEVVAIATIVRDLTEHKRAVEAQLAKEAAEASSQAKSEFLASMSHEIRTPMNGVIGMLDLTLGTQLESEQRHYLERAKASADLLLRVINDILDFSKIEAGRLDLEPTDFSLRESMGETIKGFGPQAHRKGLELALHVDPATPERLSGDVLRLVQILTNLVGNAIKFTDKGEVVVQAGVESTSGNQILLHVAVTDTGPGIPLDKQKMIFGAFAQADSSMARRFGGTGLGLAISSRLVELMGGRIWVESEVGRGSAFHFTARFELQPQSQTPAKADRLDLEEMPVLAADDNDTNLHILTEMLVNWRMKPTGVRGGRDAIEALRRAAVAGEPFPLVLLDSVMPDMDGFAVAAEIKQDPALADATIMMLSSLDGAGELKRCRELGINIYLRKPFKQSELLNAILTSLGTLASDDQTGSASGDVAPDMPRNLRILVAEDNEFNQDVVGSLLRKWDHTVSMASNGKAALAALEKESFDLVLMDVQMPEMDGLSTAQAIRAKERTAQTPGHIPIVALTAHAMKGDRERCIAAGMDAYVAKPIKSAELLAVMSGLLASKGGSEKTSAPVAPKSDTIFDPQAALAGIDGDRNILAQMVQWFLDQSPRLLEEVRNAVSQNDRQTLAAAAHKLKAQVGSFGAQNAYEAAARLEELATEQGAASWSDALSEVESAVAKLRSALIEYSRQPKVD